MCIACDMLPLATSAGTVTAASIFVCAKFLPKPKPRHEPRFYWATRCGERIMPAERIPSFDTTTGLRAFMLINGNVEWEGETDYTFTPIDGTPVLL